MIKLQILLVFYALRNNIGTKSKHRWYYSKLPRHVAIGFTLAEVLITLLVIGIVASIAIPALIHDTQQAEIKTSWKKAFGVASRAYKLAIIDNGTSFPPYTYSGYAGLSPKWQAMIPHMNIIKSCHGNTFGNCWTPNGVPYPNGSYGSGGCSGFSKERQNATYAYVTADGMYWLGYGTGTVSYDVVAVDVNGPKGPNIFSKDVFDFSMLEARITPHNCDGSPDTLYLN